MKNVKLEVNSKIHELDVEEDTPLLWVLRDHLHLTGTKYGCGIAQCGACTVHVNGVAMRSCATPISAVNEAAVTTIEGLSENNDHILQLLWQELNVPQCGYCQSGMLMAAADLLNKFKVPTDDQIDMYISNICRCGTYPRVRDAIYRAAIRAQAES